MSTPAPRPLLATASIAVALAAADTYVVVLALTDIVCYLIFAAYIVFMVRFAPQECWNNDVSGLVTAQQMASSAARVGGIPLVIGLLHGLNIVLMPVLGRLFSLNRRVPGPRTESRQEADW